jgi:hypothetical protein
MPDIRRGNPRSSGYRRQPHDFYVEPEWAVAALLNAERFTGAILDPACGTGTIPRICREHGLHAAGSDIADRGFGVVVDFFDLRTPVDNIISNPPFRLVEEFIDHALELARDKVAILARLSLPEGLERRRMMWDSTPFSRCLVFSRRVSMPPGGRAVPVRDGSVAYAWFIWQHGHEGPAVIGHIP